MEPPQLAAAFVLILATIELLVVASYEATFAVISRSTLEKMHENAVARANLMIEIHESRQRLRLMARIGEAAGIVALTLSFLYLVRPILLSFSAVQFSALVAAAASLVVFMATSNPRRLRFEDNGEEARIPAIALIFLPLHALLMPPTRLLERLFVGNYEDVRAEKEEELRSIVESEGETGVLEEGEKEMIQSVFGFHDSIVREVMVPRVDIVAVEQSATVEDLLKVIKRSGHSRIPVYEESLDQIRGIIYTKDVLQILVNRQEDNLTKSLSHFMADAAEGTPPENNDLSFLHEPYYVPETKKIDELLRDLRAARTRLAIVIDEYSGTAGVVTTEDLVEEIVGEIQDEYDEEEDLFYWKVHDETLIANARLSVDDLNELLETDLSSEGFDTLGGFVYDHLGQVPSEGQSLATDNLQMRIMKVEGQRISQVEIRRLRVVDEGETT